MNPLFDKTLFLIPARGGSKGIPRKNIKVLDKKPLICHSIDIAKHFVDDAFICVSTDDLEIKSVCENYGLNVPFLRPAQLATDTAGSDEIIMHALEFYQKQSINIEKIVLLQPTSPFRKATHVENAMDLYEQNIFKTTPNPSFEGGGQIPHLTKEGQGVVLDNNYNNQIDMVISVKETEVNPYYLLCNENKQGFLEKFVKDIDIIRRQDAPKVYQYNGAVYIINVKSFLEHKKLSAFEKVIKYEMDNISSVDLDTLLDWAYAEFLIEKQYFKYE